MLRQDCVCEVPRQEIGMFSGAFCRQEETLIQLGDAHGCWGDCTCEGFRDWLTDSGLTTLIMLLLAWSQDGNSAISLPSNWLLFISRQLYFQSKIMSESQGQQLLPDEEDQAVKKMKIQQIAQDAKENHYPIDAQSLNVGQSKDQQPQEANQKQVVIVKPKKADFRMHAHVNPLNETLFPYPLNYKMVDWSYHYPQRFGKDPLQLYLNTLEYPLSYVDQVEGEKSQPIVNFLDIGCGFGGLCFALSEHFPNKYTLGMEIRGKVVNYVGEKIRALRNEGRCHNVSVIRTNAMRHLPQYFQKGTLEKIFICFPDPHFKKKNFRRRIVNPGLLSEYAYLLKQHGRLYCITDVEELHNWHAKHIEGHKMFRKIDVETDQEDLAAKLIWNSTEEGQKVERNKGKKFMVVSERV